MTNTELLEQMWFYRTIRDFVMENYNLESKEEIDEFINGMTRRELLDAWLTWEGLIDYTDTIIDIVCSLFQDEEYGGLNEIDFDETIDGSFI